MDLPEQVKIQRAHPVVVGDAREKVHQDELTIPLSSIPGLLLGCGLLFGPTLDNNDRGSLTTSDGCKNIQNADSGNACVTVYAL